MNITYIQQGDYLLPNLTLPEQDSRPIGLWGQQHLRYIKRSRPILYTNLLTKCKLNEYLADIDEQAQKMYDELVQAFAKEEGCTEKLKATNSCQAKDKPPRPLRSERSRKADDTASSRIACQESTLWQCRQQIQFDVTLFKAHKPLCMRT